MHKNKLLSFEEIMRIVTILQPLGLRKVRITGGEPLLRKNVTELIKQLQEAGIEDIALTTNGVLLKKFAKELKEAGLHRINVSLDAIDNQVFQEMVGRKTDISEILSGIEVAKEVGLGVKINMVVRKGWNDSQILPMAKYCKEHQLELRFIEFMDVGSTNSWCMDEVVTSKEIRELLHKEMRIQPKDDMKYGDVAVRYSYEDGSGTIGFISSVTEAFCGSCTRIRLSADGKLFTCLFANKGHDIREQLRNGIDNEGLALFIRNIWGNRDDRYSEERTELMKNNKQKEKIEMSYIGG